MPNYETVFIIKPELPDDKVNEVLEKIKGIISSCDGNVVLTDSWGRRRLAYNIGKNKEGNYFLLQFSAAPEITGELDKYFKTSDNIIRHMVIRFKKSFKKKVDIDKAEEKKDAAPAAATGPVETAPAAPPQVSPAVPAVEEIKQ